MVAFFLENSEVSRKRFSSQLTGQGSIRLKLVMNTAYCRADMNRSNPPNYGGEETGRSSEIVFGKESDCGWGIMINWTTHPAGA